MANNSGQERPIFVRRQRLREAYEAACRADSAVREAKTLDELRAAAQRQMVLSAWLRRNGLA